MTFPTGHIPDHPEVVKSRIGLHLHAGFGLIMGVAASLPMQTTNRVFMPPSKGGPGILNQGATSSCEGHAHGSGGTLRLAILGQSKGLISPVQLYLGALMCDATVQPDGMLSTITDTGTMPSSIQQAWLTFGAELAKDDLQYPASRATMYAQPANDSSALLMPRVEQLYNDSAYRYTGTYFITAQGTQRLLQALSTLASGRPITDAIPASGTQFQGYTGGILGALEGPVDHANMIVDYSWLGTAADWATFLGALAQNSATLAANLSSQLVLHCVNSWGDGWGEADAIAQVAGGTYRADCNYFDQAEDLCVVDISQAA